MSVSAGGRSALPGNPRRAGDVARVRLDFAYPFARTPAACRWSHWSMAMTIEDPHPSDREMLLAADGELSSRRAASIRAHFAGCWACRTRMSELETTIRDFIELHRSGLDPLLPAAAGPR